MSQDVREQPGLRALVEKVTRAGAQAQFPIAILCMVGEDNDNHLCGIPTQCSQHVEATPVGKLHIQNHDVGTRSEDKRDGRLHARGFAGKLGYASALAWALFVIVMLITALQFSQQKRLVNYDN